jgi:hypothetical protein
VRSKFYTNACRVKNLKNFALANIICIRLGYKKGEPTYGQEKEGSKEEGSKEEKSRQEKGRQETQIN